jgi:hypothetical protein
MSMHEGQNPHVLRRDSSLEALRFLDVVNSCYEWRCIDLTTIWIVPHQAASFERFSCDDRFIWVPFLLLDHASRFLKFLLCKFIHGVTS